MEALQMLKFMLKKKRLHFMDGWITDSSLMCDATARVEEDVRPSTLGAILGATAQGDFEAIALGMLDVDEEIMDSEDMLST
jgi:hypothetical protein